MYGEEKAPGGLYKPKMESNKTQVKLVNAWKEGVHVENTHGETYNVKLKTKNTPENASVRLYCHTMNVSSCCVVKFVIHPFTMSNFIFSQTNSLNIATSGTKCHNADLNLAWIK